MEAHGSVEELTNRYFNEIHIESVDFIPTRKAEDNKVAQITLRVPTNLLWAYSVMRTGKKTLPDFVALWNELGLRKKLKQHHTNPRSNRINHILEYLRGDVQARYQPSSSAGIGLVQITETLHIPKATYKK